MLTTEQMQPFNDAVNDPLSAETASKEREIIGTLCTYAPEELIWAAGFHPMRLFSSKSDIVLAENHLQAYCCSLVRGILEDSLAGRLDFLTGTVFPHTCDSMQRLSDIWRLKGKYKFFADVVLPVKLNTPSARTYMLDILNTFRTELEAAGGRPILEQDLHEAIHLFNRIRRSLRALYDIKSQNPSIISGADLYTLVKGSMIMDKVQAADRLEQLVSTLMPVDTPENDTGRVILSGSVCDSAAYYQVIESADVQVVADDLCTGQRWFDGEIEDQIDPMAAIADRYMDRMICPAKHSDLTIRGEHLASLAKKHRAGGVVFLLLKFCDPHAFDYPYLKEFLETRGIKTLRIEVDEQQDNAGQITTRIETFAHMI
ncbi:MAG: 2-hydroxyacyl-CoA dehydratase [Desulfobacteraceae bacterium]|nr:MAG: 2-hydroxyacyl-CoA dehydratase [Desulfobacteraceae bacterium]